MKKTQLEQVKQEISRRSFLLKARNVGAAAAVVGIGASLVLGSAGCEVYADYSDYTDGYADAYADAYADYTDVYGDYIDGYSDGYADYGDYTDGYSDGYLDLG